MDNRVARRTEILTNHLLRRALPPSSVLQPHCCLSYSPPELSNEIAFDTREMRRLMDGHNLEDRDWLFSVIVQSALFNRRDRAGRIFVCPDYNQSMEQQREVTLRRIEYLVERGVFRGWLIGEGPEEELKKLALHEVIGMYDHSLAVKLGVHYFLWLVMFSLFFFHRFLLEISGNIKKSLISMQWYSLNSFILSTHQKPRIGQPSVWTSLLVFWEKKVKKFIGFPLFSFFIN